jgi:thiamine pyrophosphokinase
VRTFIVAGGPGGEPPWGLAPQPGDTVIAADLGARHARSWGWLVHLLIGDLDSLDATEVERLRDAGVAVVTAPAAKDETDLELALSRALAADPQSIVIAAALGGRIDHLLANVFLLARPDLRGRDVRISDGPETVRLLWGASGEGQAAAPTALEVCGAPGDLLSLLPLGGDAEGVSTEGLLYPLADETLHAGRGRGVSNVLLGPVARVMLRKGMLLVTHTQLRQEPADLQT